MSELGGWVGGWCLLPGDVCLLGGVPTSGGALITHPGMEHTAQDRPWDQRQEVTSTPLLWTEWQTLAKTLPSLATIIALGSKVSDRLRRITNNPRDLDNVLLFQAGWTQRYAYHCKHVGASLNPQYQESREMVSEKGTPWSHADSIYCWGSEHKFLDFIFVYSGPVLIHLMLSVFICQNILLCYRPQGTHLRISLNSIFSYWHWDPSKSQISHRKGFAVFLFL